MVDDIVFHLGDCKTGTTSVQGVLASGSWSAPGNAIVYPARFNHIPLAKTLSVPAEKPKEAARFAAVREAFAKSDATHGVISAEHFEFVNPDELARAIETHLGAYAGRIRLVAYVRPHADRLVSTFAERAKKGLFMGSLEDMHESLAADRLLFYTPRFQRWRSLFGDAFTLRPFVRDRLWQGDVVQDFFKYVMGEGEFEITRPTDRNESLSVQDIAMMRAVHAMIRKRHRGQKMRQTQQALGWYMADLLGQAPLKKGTKPRLHRDLVARVVDAYAEDAAALDAAFFDGAPLSRALASAAEKAVELPQSYDAKEYFTPAERRQFRVWTKLLMRVMEADPDHFAWAVRPPSQRAPHPPSGLRFDVGAARGSS